MSFVLGLVSVALVVRKLLFLDVEAVPTCMSSVQGVCFTIL